MTDPILESSFKAENTIDRYIFLLLSKKVDKFQLCLKRAASLFPFSCMTFLIKTMRPRMEPITIHPRWPGQVQ